MNGEVTEEFVGEITKEVGFFQDLVQEIKSDFLSLSIKVLLAILVLVVGLFIIRLIRKAVRRAFDRASEKIDTSGVKFIDQTISVILHAILFILIAQFFGVSAASVVALLGSAGLTIGLAFQGALSNFAGGVLLLLHRPFQIGDYVIIGADKSEGVVSEIGMINTTIVFNAGKTMIIPNGTLANTTITNLSNSGRRLLEIVVGIAYDASIKDAKEIMRKLAKQEGMIDDENLLVYVNALSDSSVDIGVRGFVPLSKYFAIKTKLNEEIKLAFDEAGIEISFNQLDVHIDHKIVER